MLSRFEASLRQPSRGKVRNMCLPPFTFFTPDFDRVVTSTNEEVAPHAYTRRHHLLIPNPPSPPTGTRYTCSYSSYIIWVIVDAFCQVHKRHDSTIGQSFLASGTFTHLTSTYTRTKREPTWLTLPFPHSRLRPGSLPEGDQGLQDPRRQGVRR